MNNDNKQTVEFEDEDDNRSLDTDNVFYDDDSHTPQDYTAEELLDETSRKHSYDSRESASEGSPLSESPCDSLSHNLRPLSLESPYSSRCTVEEISHQNQQELLLFSGNPFQTEKEFINYLMSLPSSKAESTTTLYQIPLPVVHSNSKELVTLKPNQPQSTSGTQSPKVGLDHLENLCKLMEQLGELREQNCKLQKRVQYLEEMRCLNEMRKDLKEALEVATTYTSTMRKTSDNDDLESTGRNIISITEEENDAMTQIPFKRLSKSNVKLRKSALKQEKQKRRGRSQSMGDSEQSPRGSTPSVTTSGVIGQSGKAKVSKWTKVKEALKWERAQVDNRMSTGSSNISGDTRSSFYIDGSNPSQSLVAASKGNIAFPTSAKTSKPQHTSDAMLQKLPAIQKADVTHWRSSDLSSGGGEVSAPSFFFRDSYVDTSSTDDDDDDEHYLKEMKRIATEGNKRQSLGAMLGLGEQYSSLVSRRKSSPTRRFPEDLMVDDTQGKSFQIATFIQSKLRLSNGVYSHIDRKGQSLDRNVDPKTLSKHTMSEKDSKKLAKGTWGKMKTIIQTRKDSLKRKHRKSGADQATGCNITPDLSSGDLSLGGENMCEEINDATTCYQSKMHLDDTSEHYDVPVGQTKSKHSSSSSNYGLEDIIGTEMLPHDKMKMKTNKLRPQQLTIQAPPIGEHFNDGRVKSGGAGYSPTSNRKSKWTKVKKVLLNKREGESNSVPASPTNPKDFSYDDDLKLLEEYFYEEKDWDTQSKSNYETVQETEKCQLSTDARRNLEELQRNVSQEFCKKLEEWEKLRRAPTKPSQQPPCFELDRKGSTNKSSKSKVEKTKDKPHDRDHKDYKQREKELQWLEKQLQKIEREKQRLAKERQKYLEREARLEKMKQTMMKPSIKNEILVRTAAGEFRFEGISQTFTRKLYEWEAMKGIGPEVSTIALLDSQQYQPQRSHSVKDTTITDDKPNLLSPPILKYGRLDRGRSRSDGSIADIVNVQTSTTSLVHEDVLTDDVFLQDITHSRANSEPDMVFVSSEPPCAVEVEEMHYEESIPCLEIPAVHIEEPIYSYTPSEVTHLIDSSGSSDAEREYKGHIQAKSNANEEKVNVDQLKPSTSNSDTNLIQASETNQDETTTKDDICRKLESELEDIDDRMKIMFQQHAEEIKDDDEKQLELIEDLRARIQQIEKASEFLEKERDLQEATSLQEKAHTSSQLQFPEKLKTNAKKKEGVVKIQAISTELLQQAKTLEETLIERNATIKQLQWELVQRDLSSKILEEELHHGKESDNSKKKGTHNRSWSSVDGAYTSCGTKTQKEESPKVLTPKPSPFLGRVINPECAVLPTEITNKVRELKTELMRLWSSGESTTSDQGTEEQLPCHIEEDKQKAVIEEQVTSLTSHKSDKHMLETPGKEDTQVVDIPKFVDRGSEPKKTTKCGGEETVTARRVSDTSVPQDLQITPEFGRQHRRTVSRIPKSPDVKKSRDKTELPTATLHNNTKDSQHEVAPKSSRLCRYPQSPITTPRNEIVRQKRLEDNKEHDQDRIPLNTVDTTSVNYTVSLRKKPVNEKSAIEAHVESERQVNTYCKSNVTTGPSITSSIPIKFNTPITNKKTSTVIEEELQIGKDITAEDEVNRSGVAKKNSASIPSKEKSIGTHALQRQNAEDLGSSSDTDTEGSGVTFTINIANKERNKKLCEEAEKRPKLAKTDTSGYSVLKKISYNTLCTPPMPRANIISTPPQSPIAPWRRSNANNDKSLCPGQSKQQLTPTMKSKLSDGHSSHQSQVKPNEEIQRSDSNTLFAAITAESAPVTPVVKSRSTRKLKLPTAIKSTDSGTNSSCASPLLEPSPLIHRKGLVRSKDTAPNVKMMVEKFNKKIIQEQSSPTMIRSPHFGLQRKGMSYNGVQKSTSFTVAQETPVGDSVMKSASAGVIEESTSRFFGQRFSQSPELYKKQTTSSWASQPIGIASRIPRSLKSILEQDSSDTAKDLSGKCEENGERNSETSEKRIQNSVSDARCLHTRQVREDFMSKTSISSSSSSTSPPLERHSSSTPPTKSKFGLSTHPKHTNIPVPKTTQSSPSDGQSKTVNTTESQKPKSILKLLHREPRAELVNDPITDTKTKIMKSASAGMMEVSATKTSSRSSEDLAISGSKTPEPHQQPHKSGLFNFKFRKAKMKQKKEPQNTVQTLCRQSLVVDIQQSGDGKGGLTPDGQEELLECGTQSTVSTRSCPSSPELQPRTISKGGWLTKPKILFRSK